ncbi:MAG: GIY-YIG nuclease family protein [Bacteroidota bacterium]
MKLYYVYILKCSDDSYYTGFSSNLDNRIMQHKMGYYRECYTFKRRPVELVFYEAFTEPNQGIYFEKKIKGWSRLKKEALISGNFDRLPLLAECKNESTHKNNTKGFDSAQPDKE